MGKYGLPLIDLWPQTIPLLESPGVNKLERSTGLGTPSSSLLGPNVDTLYGFALFDISASDLIVTVPEVDPSRYWSFAFFDPYVTAFLGPA